MRCIEIAMQTTGKMAQQTININMRCIEILIVVLIFAQKARININMRCIEINEGDREEAVDYD